MISTKVPVLACCCDAHAIICDCLNSKPTKIKEPITPITPRKLATPVNDIATGIFEDTAVHL